MTREEIEETIAWADYYQQLAIAADNAGAGESPAYGNPAFATPPLPKNYWVPYAGGEGKTGGRISTATSEIEVEKKKSRKKIKAGGTSLIDPGALQADTEEYRGKDHDPEAGKSAARSGTTENETNELGEPPTMPEKAESPAKLKRELKRHNQHLAKTQQGLPRRQRNRCESR